MTYIQLAIVSSSKHFLSLPLIQHLIAQIYSGHLIYSPTSSRSLISDSYVSERTKARRRGSNTTLRPIENNHNNHSSSSPSPTPSASASSSRVTSGRKSNARSATRTSSDTYPGIDNEDLAEVYIYNPYEAGWLDHQRLRVPRWRKWLDFLNFAVLLGLFVTTLSCEFPGSSCVRFNSSSSLTAS